MKRILIPLALLLCACLLTACASRNLNGLSASPSPSAGTGDASELYGGDALPEGTDPMMPDVSMEPVINDSSAAQGVTTVAAARRAVEQIENELERLSEVTEAQVMVAGNTAAVALRFDNQYGTGVDERIRTMVEERVKGVVNDVSRVYVTEDRALFDELESLGEKLTTASVLTELRQEMNQLVTRIDPLA